MLLILANMAEAHQPFVVGNQAYSEQTAFVVEEPEVSIVVYAQPDCERKEVWLALEGEPGEEVYVELGVPLADSLEGWHPKLALVEEGLENDASLELPEGLGGQELLPLSEPERFDEPFSGTSSWILVKQYVTMPETGPAWVVAYPPEEGVGRLWVAVGEVERFDQEDWERTFDLMDDIRSFHGLDGTTIPAPDACAPPPARKEEPAGCATTSSALNPCLLLVAMAITGRRNQIGRAHV